MPGTTQNFTFCLCFFIVEGIVVFGGLAGAALGNPGFNVAVAALSQGGPQYQVSSGCSFGDIICWFTGGAINIGNAVASGVAWISFFGGKILTILSLPTLIMNMPGMLALGVLLIIVNVFVSVMMMWDVLSSIMGGS